MVATMYEHEKSTFVFSVHTVYMFEEYCTHCEKMYLPDTRVLHTL